MTRYYWRDTLEPMLGEPAEADEDMQQLGRKLEKLAEQGGAMSAVEMDGFVAGLVVAPATVPAPEWLAQVWGSEAVFDNIEEAGEMEAALLGHYNEVARALEAAPERYRPLLEVDERTGEGVLWKPWIVGFARAMRLRPAAWARFESSNDLDVQESLQVIHKLYKAANGTSDLVPMGLDLLDNLAPMLIGGAVRVLNVARKTGGGDAAERLVPNATHETVAQAVRESPCACGSGRAYSRCCGAH